MLMSTTSSTSPLLFPLHSTILFVMLYFTCQDRGQLKICYVYSVIYVSCIFVYVCSCYILSNGVWQKEIQYVLL